MKKVFQKIINWFKYVVLKLEHTETEIKYGKDVNKKGRVYYYKDTFKVDYVGTKEINRTRTRVFVNAKEYFDNTYNE